MKRLSEDVVVVIGWIMLPLVVGFLLWSIRQEYFKKQITTCNPSLQCCQK